VLIFAIKIPLVHGEIFNVYNLIPLPISLNFSNAYSYIDPSYPYLLMSTTKTHYSRLKDLSSCIKLTQNEYICRDTIIQLTSEQPVCETLLRSGLTQKIPSDCSTKTLKADLELWHPLNRNSWLYITTSPTVGTLACDRRNIETTDITFKGTGIFTMAPRCKCYTTSSTLYASRNSTQKYIHFIPDININTDGCCNRKIELLQSQEMIPVKLRNVNLDNLRASKEKLQQIDAILQRNLEESSIMSNNYFKYSVGPMCILIITLVYCGYKYCNLKGLCKRCSGTRHRHRASNSHPSPEAAEPFELRELQPEIHSSPPSYDEESRLYPNLNKIHRI
jgi:hypothetical protein